MPNKFLVTAAVIFAAVIAWHIIYPSGTLHYRITVVIETPEGIKTGSSVWEFSSFCEPQISPDQSSCHASLSKGEAVAVDMGKRGTLYALMRGGRYNQEYGEYILYESFPFREASPLTPEGVRHFTHLTSGKKILEDGHEPLLVYFKDERDPKTVASVGALHTTFGEGVNLKQISIEITDDEVSRRGIERRLPWLFTLKDYLSGQSFGVPGGGLTNTLDVGDFRRGFSNE